jgi:hypothetical protein
MIATLPLPEVAKIARKSSRTIRRWCQAGLIKGARCSRGGHWKVRVFIGKKDREIIRRRARQAGGSQDDLDRETWGRVQEKVWDAVKPTSQTPPKLPEGMEFVPLTSKPAICGGRGGRPPALPAGHERQKKAPKISKEEEVRNSALAYAYFSDKHEGEPVELATREKAEELFAASELAEAEGFGASLYPAMKKVREIGFMPIPKECFTYLLHPRYQRAFLAAGRDPIKTAFYGAALNLMKSGNPCSVAAICRRVGVSRATAYRKRVLDMVALARRDQMGVFAEATETRNAPKTQINRDRD